MSCIAQLYVTYKKFDRTKVLLAMGDKLSGWNVTNGHLQESSFVSIEYVNLQAMAEFNGWDTN